VPRVPASEASRKEKLVGGAVVQPVQPSARACNRVRGVSPRQPPSEAARFRRRRAPA
jgi:hypothetical protein